MRSIILPITNEAREYFKDQGVITIPAIPFLTTLAEKVADGMEPIPLERGEDFLEYVLQEET